MLGDQKVTSQVSKGLPISADEEVLAVYKHHWFAYAVIWLSGLAAIIILIVAAMTLYSTISTSPTANPNVNYKQLITIGTALLSFIILLGTFIPLTMRMGEQLVVTDEAVFQVLQPSVFSSKVSQLGLQHVNDVSVRKDMFGTIFGYGTVTIETPGEQENYHFRATNKSDEAVATIVEAHENFSAALESGRLPTTLNKNTNDPHAVTIDAAEYQKFLDFQQFQARDAQERQTSDVNRQENRQDKIEV